MEVSPWPVLSARSRRESGCHSTTGWRTPTMWETRFMEIWKEKGTGCVKVLCIDMLARVANVNSHSLSFDYAMSIKVFNDWTFLQIFLTTWKVSRELRSVLLCLRKDMFRVKYNHTNTHIQICSVLNKRYLSLIFKALFGMSKGFTFR